MCCVPLGFVIVRLSRVNENRRWKQAAPTSNIIGFILQVASVRCHIAVRCALVFLLPIRVCDIRMFVSCFEIIVLYVMPWLQSVYAYVDVKKRTHDVRLCVCV